MAVSSIRTSSRKKGGRVVDYKVVYNDDYLAQMMEYGKKYATL